MDFYKIAERSLKKDEIEIYPDFKVCRSKDLMVRGKSFYAIWDEERGLWSTDEYDVARLVDEDLAKYYNEHRDYFHGHVKVKYLSNYSSKSWVEFKNYISRVSDSSKELDVNVTFANTSVEKKSYVSKRLNYSMEEGDCPAYEEIMSTLYSPEERAKIEWAIGSIIAGDSKKIQKFLVLYGDPGTGKSTVLEIIQKMFDGYYTIFEAKALTSSSNVFSTEAFKSNPLIAIQHDGDLSKIEDNSKLNSIVSHEEIIINEKYKASYPMRVNCFLFMATNKPVKITDSKAGLIRRLIDVRPTGNKLEASRYFELRDAVEFELGAIAAHCLKVYQSMGKDYYNKYRPVDMMYKTDPFFNFVENYYYIFKDENATTLKAAYSMYKEYCEEANISSPLQLYKFREELKNYFTNFEDEARVDGIHIRSYYSGFIAKKFKRTMEAEKKSDKGPWLKFDNYPSRFDKDMSDCPAQYATLKETPSKKWESVTTTLKDIDTSRLHYVRVPLQHIVIDFDKKDGGKKSFEKNLEAALKWPPTYAELSKSGEGIHLHYNYTGDVTQLSRVFEDDVEIKVFNGNSSLRRKLTKCNDISISTISSGLPLKERGETMVKSEAVKSEKGLRALILRNLNKEIHPGTKPSIDFICKILDDANASGMVYDISDMRPAIMAFAANSSNHADYCLKQLANMKFKSENEEPGCEDYPEDEIVFYDVEVFPNLFLVNWKIKGEGHKVVRMINPTSIEIEDLVKRRLVGFNCRRYDNHILYARMMGYSNEELFRLSQRIVSSGKGSGANCFFSRAYNISYTDIYDYASKKQSLKKWEIELGIHHQELGLPWDQPVPEELWEKVAEYCDNDVIATEAVWNATEGDFIARQILAEVAGGTVNDTTNSLTTKIIFGSDRKPELVYTDLATGKATDKRYERKDVINRFPGYKYENNCNIYRNEDVGKGGYVYANPGVYGRTVTFDVASMHPSSILAMNCFGKYTERFKELMDARIAIKHKDFDKAKNLLNGVLAKYLNDPSKAKALAGALKIAINSVYGLTSASFDNPFRDNRNENNIVALRGALFMVNLKHEVEKRGFVVAHIKTDSIKIVEPTQEIYDFVMDYGKQYGYNFEVEHIFEKICLVNNAVYIAKLAEDDPDDPGKWTATGTQFAVPYVFKTLFSHEPITFSDLCETKEVKGAIYIDFNEGLPNVELFEKIKLLRDKVKRNVVSSISKKDFALLDEYESYSDEQIEEEIARGHNYHFVGKVGLFCPIKSNCGAGDLVREDGGKYYAVTDTKDYRWMEAEQVKTLGKENDIDITYYDEKVAKAIDAINKVGSFQALVGDGFEPAPFNGAKIKAA